MKWRVLVKVEEIETKEFDIAIELGRSIELSVGKVRHIFGTLACRGGKSGPAHDYLSKG
jgi:hypothetical protein